MESYTSVLPVGKVSSNSSCLVCNAHVFNLGSDFAVLSLQNVNTVCELLQLPQLGGLELGSVDALITFCSKCNRQIQAYQLLMTQLNDLMAQIETIRKDVKRQIIQSRSKVAATYIQNTRKLLSSQLVRVGAKEPATVTQDLNLPLYESISSSQIEEENEILAKPDFGVDHFQLEDATSNGNYDFSSTLDSAITIYPASDLEEQSSFQIFQHAAYESNTNLVEEEDDDVIDLTDEPVAPNKPRQQLRKTPHMPPTFSCTTSGCIAQFDSEAQLQRHRRFCEKLTPETPKHFKCLHCPKVSKEMQHHIAHVRHKHPEVFATHHLDVMPHRLVSAPLPCTFPNCNEGFFRPVRLKQHIFAKHRNEIPPVPRVAFPPKPKPIKLTTCTFEGCDMQFEKRHHMYIHKKAAHGC